uniref:Dihydroorotate dehydrogenase (quinone), mitochondrial n=1 Tax=Daphnia similis TaxID=35528 RepID=A0A4Y7N1H0_9CRUS|nr:EOG090X08P9 [Daphnia similis]SVE86839.1 EOG090X08P9 [Daphnia similis]SVE87465.1 EOG090X08P9 [Daphnia similis]SVE88093.1 EOG090X08P9 [Daphnia similis]
MYTRKEKFIKQLTALVTVTLGGTTTFASLCIWNGNENFYRDYVMPFTRRLDPETSHGLAVLAMKHCLIKKQLKPDAESLSTRLWNINFSNPVGLAAGFDKQAEGMQGLHRTGFGFVEIGSVTPKPQEGNPKPRVFRLEEDNAIINRYGFNSEGHEAVFNRVRQEKGKQERAIIGVNLGKNKVSAMEDVRDYVIGVEKFGAIADYLVINISSPNTPGLRGLQQKAELENLISSVLEARNKLGTAILPPLLVKIAPDLSEAEKKDVVSVILKDKCRVDGIIVCNTTTSRPSDLKSQCKDEIGGLSGQPLKDISTRCIRDFYRLTNGQIPIIGVGGIASGQDAYEKILAGASLVQLYTSFALQGPPVVRRIKRELDEILRSNGYQNVAEAIGKSSQGN